MTMERGFPHFPGMAMTLRGWSKAVIGHVEDGIAEIEDGIARWQAVGFTTWLPWFGALLAEARLVAGQAEDALERTDEALETIMQAGLPAPPAMPASIISTKTGTSPLSIDQVFSQEISHG